jgi:hypothetical protein
MSAEENTKLMKTLDDAWNSQDWETFTKRHIDDVIVRWPAQPPTEGRANLTIEPTDILGVYSDPKRDPCGHVISIVFIGKIIGGEVRAGDDADSFQWVSYKE